MKPENIFIKFGNQNKDTAMEVKIGDFGQSKLLISDINNLGELVLKKEQSVQTTRSDFRSLYKPPESSSSYAKESDIFILGLILFDMLNCNMKISDRDQLHYTIIYGKKNQLFQPEFAS